MRRLIAIVCVVMLPTLGLAQEAEQGGPMTPSRLADILFTLDEAARIGPNGAQLTIDDVPIVVVMDPIANRMRALVPVASVEGLSEADLLRVLQANFDTALDARYAVANGRLWSTFIHPLSELERPQLISGLVQTVILARTYGLTYSSGAVSFGAGDSSELHRELLEEFLRRGEEL